MRRIIDERGRLFGRISIVDLFVLIIAAVIILAVYVRFNTFSNPASSTDTINVTYVVGVHSVQLSNAISFRVGDKLYSRQNDEFLGTIMDIDIKETVAPGSLLDGTIVMASVEDRYDVMLTVSSQCSHSNGRYYADGIFELKTNSWERMYSKYHEIGAGIIMTIAAE